MQLRASVAGTIGYRGEAIGEAFDVKMQVKAAQSKSSDSPIISRGCVNISETVWIPGKLEAGDGVG